MRPEYEKIAELFGLTVEAEPEVSETEAPKEGRDAIESAQLAAESLAEGKVAKAVRLYQQAIELKGEEDPDLLVDLGAAFEYGDDAPQAIQQYMKARNNPDSATEALLGISTILRREGKFQDAIAQLDEALTQTPKSAYLWSKLAEIFREMGERKKALSAIQMAILNQPDQSHYHYWAGDLLLAMGSFPEALQALKAAIELSPGDAHLLLLAGIAFWRLDKRPEAVRSLRLASDLDHEDALYPALADMLEAYSGTEKVDRAKVKLDRYDLDRLNRVLRQLGLQSLDSGV